MDNVPIPPASTQLKTASNGYLGFIHYLLGGLVFPIIIGLFANVILKPIPQGNTTTYIGYVFGLIGVWVGVWYSAKVLKKRYLINNPKKAANIATVWYFVVAVFVFFVLASVILNVEQQTGQTSLGLGQNADTYRLQLWLSLVQILLFNWLSKKYLTQQHGPTV